MTTIDDIPRYRTALQLFMEAVDGHARLGTGRHGNGFETLVPAGSMIVFDDGPEVAWNPGLRFLDPVQTFRHPVSLECGYNWDRARSAARALVVASRNPGLAAVVWLARGPHVGPSYLVLLGTLR